MTDDQSRSLGDQRDRERVGLTERLHDKAFRLLTVRQRLEGDLVNASDGEQIFWAFGTDQSFAHGSHFRINVPFR